MRHDDRVFSAEISGKLIGPIWDGSTCTMSINVLISKAQGVGYRKLESAARITLEQAGDFQTCRFTRDSHVIITMYRGRGDGRREWVYRRIVGIDEFPSLMPYVESVIGSTVPRGRQQPRQQPRHEVREASETLDP